MPGLDGLETSEHIKNNQSLNKTPAIIMVSAYGKEEIMQRAEQMGLDGFLIKPVSSSVLFDTIMHAFGEGVSNTARISERTGKAEDLTDLHGAQILLVEDNEINQQVAQEILESAGLHVTLANDGQQGLDAAMQHHYDAILMDIQMPVMDGYTATREIRKWESEVGSRNAEVGPVVVPNERDYAAARMRKVEGGMGDGERKLKAQSSKLKAEKKLQAHSSKQRAEKEHKAESSKLNGEDSEDLSAYSLQLSARAKRVPIIAMTAHAMAGDEQKSLDAGMDGHVTKPIDPDQLFATLQKWIQPAAERAAGPKPQPLDLTSKPEQPSPDADGLPESLPGFDLGAGLKRLGGNSRLYRKLLLDFGANYGETAGQISAALAAGDFDQAHSLVHNIKGLAGNLEATDLQAAAVEMEKLVKGQTAETTSDTELNRKFAKMEKAINQALEAVRTIGLPVEEKNIEPSTEWLAEIPAERVKEITDRIKAAADMGDVMQIKSIAEELKSESDGVAPFCDKLIGLAEDFDFDGIQKIVIELDS